MTVVVDAAETAQRMIVAGDRLPQIWRHVILQTIDSYESVLRLHGVEKAATVFADEPSLVGDDRVDPAPAALAEHLDVVTRAFLTSRRLPKTECLLSEIVEDQNARTMSDDQ